MSCPHSRTPVKLCQFFNMPLEYLLVGQKADFRYHDLRLAELFLQADALPAEYRTIITAYLRSVMKHATEKERLDRYRRGAGAAVGRRNRERPSRTEST